MIVRVLLPGVENGASSFASNSRWAGGAAMVRTVNRENAAAQRAPRAVLLAGNIGVLRRMIKPLCSSLEQGWL